MERFLKDGVPDGNEEVVNLPLYEQSVVSDNILMEEIEFEQGRTDPRESAYFPRTSGESMYNQRISAQPT